MATGKVSFSQNWFKFNYREIFETRFFTNINSPKVYDQYGIGTIAPRGKLPPGYRCDLGQGQS